MNPNYIYHHHQKWNTKKNVASWQKRENTARKWEYYWTNRKSMKHKWWCEKLTRHYEMNAWNVGQSNITIYIIEWCTIQNEKERDKNHTKTCENQCNAKFPLHTRYVHDCNDFSHGFIRIFDLFRYHTDEMQRNKTAWYADGILFQAKATCNFCIYFFLPNLCVLILFICKHTWTWCELKWNDFRKSLCCSHFPQTHIHNIHEKPL